ncbi:MAG: acyl-CoA dehydrogenase family protein [Bacteroidota bacterium]
MGSATTSENTISFEPTEEMRLLKQSASEFAESEIRPVVMKYDESQEFPVDIVKKMADLGFLGVVTPESLGGAGMTATEFVVIMEELARVDPSVALTFAAHSGLCLEHLLQFANDDQKKKYVPDLATGKKIGSWCLTEPGSGSDAGAMLTTAERKGSEYILNGSKSFITNGSYASTFVVMAKTNSEKGKPRNSAFIVEKEMGVRVGKKENKLGFRSSDTVQLVFDNVHVPAANLLGEEGQGLKQALSVLDSGRVGIAALSVGLAQGAMEASIKYAKERKAFGKTLGEFQGIQFKLADMATEIEASRLLTYRAAVTKAAGAPLTLVAAYAKYFASEMAQRVANEAVQIHGGYGFVKDYPVEKFYRDVKLLTIGEGTSEVQRMVIAKNLLL